jgi:hypothetical protein
MDIKKKEFLNLTQGHRDVMSYVNAFNTLSQYGPDEVSSDAKKRERFYDGLSEELQDKLSTTKFNDFNDLVNIAIRAEHKMKRLEAKQKRPAPNSAGGSSSGPRVGPPPPPPRAPGVQPPRPMWVVHHPQPPQGQPPRLANAFWNNPSSATRVHATIVVARATSPSIVRLQGKAAPPMHQGLTTLHRKPHAKEPSHRKLLSVAVSTTPPWKRFRMMPKCSWVRFS